MWEDCRKESILSFNDPGFDFWLAVLSLSVWHKGLNFFFSTWSRTFSCRIYGKQNTILFISKEIYILNDFAFMHNFSGWFGALFLYWSLHFYVIRLSWLASFYVLKRGWLCDPNKNRKWKFFLFKFLKLIEAVC